MSKTQPKPEAPREAAPIVEAQPHDSAAETVHGRALVDLPAFSLMCGEFGHIPAADAGSLIAGGQFDDRAAPAEA